MRRPLLVWEAKASPTQPRPNRRNNDMDETDEIDEANRPKSLPLVVMPKLWYIR